MTPDQLAALAAVVRDHWGEYAYTIDAITTGSRAGAVHVHHADGSRFIVATCRWSCHYTHATDHPIDYPGTQRSASIADHTIAAALQAHDDHTPGLPPAEYHPRPDLYAYPTD